MKRLLSVVIVALLMLGMSTMAFRIQPATSSIIGDLTGGTSNPWDFVPDGMVDGKDITIVALCFGSAPGCPPPYIWNPHCDVNGDGKVDGKDIATVALNYGQGARTLAGWRSSPYELQQEKDPGYWVNVAKDMASKIRNSVPSGVWILGEDMGSQCHLTFDSSVAYPNVVFSKTDENEKYLDAFDAVGLKVWLQVEPADANVDTLIDLVLQRYHHHSCVTGFGVDVEWLQPDRYPDGRAVTSEEAQRWLSKVRSYDPNYQLFLKHWLVEKMPTAYAAGTVFVDDSQGFRDMNELADEFNQWATHFWPSKVYFQIGYASDQGWWSKLADPYQTITDKLTSENPNCNGVYWVDFTLKTLYP